ncbi:hypothetical protein MKW98_010535 [Papaver atlanticum]|uniref:Auxin response factor n=1 Tax=Papaver atlanticum TaxID=357466 RepID=A0AAD4S2C7_9MAGN|nr:hypothetical protein MKW98_010535 [Papaver atlanticum]
MSDILNSGMLVLVLLLTFLMLVTRFSTFLKVEAYTNQEFDIQLPKHNLPSQILSRVVYVQLKAELETDEVFAQVTLLPETKEEMSGIEEETSRSSIGSHSHSFSKILTASDTSTHGGFCVLKRHADECLPPCIKVALSPLYCGHPKRHLFTTGWSNYVSSKKLVTGDTFVFIRGENGELRVGVRRAMETGYILSQHATWMSPSEFLIPYNEYMSSVKNKYSIGLRFRMKFEGEEYPKQRFLKDYIRSTTTIKETLRGLAMSRKCYKRYRVGLYTPTTTSTFPYSKPRMGDVILANLTAIRKNCFKTALLQLGSCTKVLKYGTALGRSVDLMKLGGYDELIDELDRMFYFNGALIERSNGWNVIYVDDEGDTMQIGDYPWQLSI